MAIGQYWTKRIYDMGVWRDTVSAQLPAKPAHDHSEEYAIVLVSEGENAAGKVYKLFEVHATGLRFSDLVPTLEAIDWDADPSLDEAKIIPLERVGGCDEPGCCGPGWETYRLSDNVDLEFHPD